MSNKMQIYLWAHAHKDARPGSLFADVLDELADETDDDIEHEFAESDDEGTDEGTNDVIMKWIAVPLAAVLSIVVGMLAIEHLKAGNWAGAVLGVMLMGAMAAFAGWVLSDNESEE